MRVVVVGAGSAGCAVAGRLAERGHEVVLVEMGPAWRSESAPDEVRRPRDDIFAWRVDGRSPSRFAAPGVSAERFAGRGAEPYLRGQGVGGTSSINGLVAIRPSPDDFAHWQELGCDGWGWDDVLPVFRRLEDDLDYGDAEYHGMDGPVPVTRRTEAEWGSGDHLLADAAFDAGHAWEPDYHVPGALGVSRTASNIRCGVRVTSYDGYVERWVDSGRIEVVSGVTVDRVSIERGRATGVIGVDARGEPVRIDGEEVVISAGAAATPALLQRSGIGPASLLEPLGVPVVADLPVGRGMQDHVGFWLAVPHDGARPSAAGARGNVTLRASSHLDHSRPGDLLVVAANPSRTGAGETAFGVKLGHCLSTGSASIVSRDPHAAPNIAMGLLSDERDVALARHAVRWAASLLGAGGREVFDRHGRPVDAGASDRELDAWLAACASDTSHLTGGARMGSGDDAVTSTDLRVRGIDGLTVADASVCPITPRANTYLTAVMIGERAADVLAPTS